MQKKEKREKVKKEKKKTPPIYIFLRIFTIGFAIFTVIRVVAQQPALNQYEIKTQECTKNIEEEKEKIKHYDNLKELYKTEDYQMLVAKERLGLVEENEKVYIDANSR